MRAVGCDAMRLKSIGDIRAETVPTKYPNRGPIVKQMRNTEDCWRAVPEHKSVRFRWPRFIPGKGVC
jgi:hypothetical protein